MANDSMAGVALDTRLAQGSRTPEKLAAKPAGGKVLPQTGMPAPAAAPSPAPVEVPKIDISGAVRSINAFLQENQRGLRFQVDKATGRTVITVIDPVSGEIVRQIPPQELLDIAHGLMTTGALIDAHA